MTDSTSTKLYFVVGLVAALVLVPVLALAATTSPAAVQDGTTFNASAGPEVTAGEDMDVATNDVFPDSETVRLGFVTVSHAGQLDVNLTGADTSLPTIRPQASPTSDLRLAHDNTSLSASVTGGSIDSLALSDAATVGDSADDIELDTGGTGTTLTVAGLSASQVTFIDTSGSQNQALATTSVSNGEASLSVGANAQRDILLATSPPGFDVNVTSTNSSIIEGQTLTVTATVNNTGGAQGTQTVTLDAGALGTNSTSVTLASGASQTVTLSLATSTGDDGTYSATVSSDDDSDSAQVEVLENIPNFQLTSLSSNAPIGPGDTLSVDVTIENTGAKSDTQTVELTNGGTVRASTSVTLSSGASTTETLTWDTSGDAVGAVSTVATENDSETLITTQDSWGQVNSKDTGNRGPVAISPDGALVAHASGSDVIVYDAQTETAVQTVAVASNSVTSLDWHPDGHRLAIGTTGNNLHVFNQTSASNLDTLNYGGTVEDVEWSPDGGKLLAGTRAGTAYVLDADTRAQLRTESLGRVSAVAWSGDAQRFAIGGDGDVQVFEVGGGRIFDVDADGASAGGTTDVVRGLAFARDGARLVTVQQGFNTVLGPDDSTVTVHLYSVGTGTQLDRETGSGDSSYSDMSFADAVADPTDDRVAVASGLQSFDPTLVYTIGTGGLTQTEVFGGQAGSIDWSHSGQYIADSAGATEDDAGDTWRVFASLPVVDGTVTDSNGNPVGSVYVELSQAGQRIDSMVTDSSGAFTLTAPDSGTYNLTAAKTSGNQQIFETKTISVPDDGTTVPFTTTLINTGISGTVVDAQGNPIPGATVTTNRTVQSTSVNTQGAFAFSTSTGGFVVSADAPGFRSDAAAVSVTAGTVTSGVTLQLEEITGVPISGTVTDPQGNPIDGADVFVGSNATQTNLQGNYAVGVGGTGTVVLTAATSVDSKTRTVTVTDPNGTGGVDFVLSTASDPQNASGNLEIRFETDGALVNNRTVTVGFFDDSEEQFAERQTNTGVVDLGTLNETAPIVAVAEAPELFTRRIIIDDLSGDSIVFLLDDDKANATVIVNEFDIVDNTGRFSGPDTRFRLKRAMPLPGETDDVPLRVLSEDLLGADEQFGIALESDVRYRIVVENDDGDVRDLGPHFAVSEGRVTIEIGEVRFNLPNGDTFSVDATAEQTGNNTERVVFSYIDPENLTTQVSVKIYNESNESQVIHDQTHSPATGTYGNLTITETVTGTATGSNWVVEYTAERNETQSGTITVTATPEELDIPIDQGIQQLLGVGLIIIVSGLFSARNAAVGAIVVPALAGTLWLVGVLSGVVSGAAIGLAFAVGVAYQLATGGPQ